MNNTATFGPEDLKKCRVTVMGLGKFGGGISVVRYLVRQHAVVTVTDQLPHEQLQESLRQIDHLPIHRVFCGGHPAEAFEDCDLVVVNPAVKPDHPILRRCHTSGIPVVTEIQLLLQHLYSLGVQFCNQGAGSDHTDLSSRTTPADETRGVTVIGVTGSNGKSTTSALLHHLLTSEFETVGSTSSVSSSATAVELVVGDMKDQSNAVVADTNPEGEVRSCWLGGNIGGSLLNDIDKVKPNDVVVLELSSFQLHYLSDFPFAPDVAVLTEFSPNHLNWHPDVEHYKAAKQNLFRRQTRQQAAVLPESHGINGQRQFLPDQDEDNQPEWRIRSHAFRFGTVDDGLDGVFWEDNWLIVRRQGVEDAVRISLPGSLCGEHSLHNLTAAACAAVLVGADPMKFSGSVIRFPGLPYRLSISGQKDSIQMVNDSASTTPESTIAAVQTMRQRLDLQVARRTTAHPGKLVVIVGGADKGSDLSQLARQLKLSVDAVIAIGDVAQGLAESINNQPEPGCGTVIVATDFQATFRQAVELVGSTGIVLLSPGCSSFGWFRDYVDRGQQFDLLVKQWIQR